MSEEEAFSNLTFKTMKRDLDPDVREEDIALIKARVLGLSPKKRALLERLLTSRKSEFPVKAGGRDRRLVAPRFRRNLRPDPGAFAGRKHHGDGPGRNDHVVIFLAFSF